jgi:hypothetical protein
MQRTDALEQYGWWSELKHGGLLIAPARLADYFPETLPPLSDYLTEKLRTAVQRMQDGQSNALTGLLDTVLEDLLKLDPQFWHKGPSVPSTWSQRAVTGEIVKPRRVWEPPEGVPLPVFTSDTRRLGVHSGRRDVARVVDWLRRSSRKIALLTNGHQWRLIYAGLDTEAWCEWDIDFWFEEGAPSGQVLALLCLLRPEALTPKASTKAGESVAPLIQAIDATRRGQAELTAALGERVREAVEFLIQASAEVLKLLGGDGQKDVQPRDVYIAATRMVMRCVVILFAEARDLLPRDNRIYYDSYSLQGLREQLDRMAGGRAKERLRYWAAWPRLISLFRLVYFGSPHEAMPVTRYAGGLFQPGDPASEDPVSRAIAAFENSRNTPSDYWIHRILELLTRSRVKVRQGVRTMEVETPIDFSDLSSEYIGILYESLLDYQLRQAPHNEPIVFLSLGDQPALPFMRLQAISSDTLAKMFEKFKQKAQKSLSEDEEGDEEVEGEEAEGEEAPEIEEQETGGEAQAGEPIEAEREVLDTELEDKVLNWARQAVVDAKIVKKPRGKLDQRKQKEYEDSLNHAAQQLYTRVVRPGDWYLVREGATRKGSGTFYTRPQLASPITRRALQSLLYDGEAPRTPEQILALRICDPAMGSGSFLISALRYTSKALLESLYHHGRLVPRGDGTVARLADGQPVDHPSQETLPLPLQHPQFDDYLEARLRRHVVERCLYGVDNDLLAVELGRMSLWVETMDPRLPFGFLNHKLKHGNSLVGCWFDRFQDYPVMAWEREGGDKNHERFVHHFRLTAGRGKTAGSKKGDKWAVAIKQRKDNLVLAELKKLILGKKQPAFAFVEEQLSPDKVHDQVLAVFERLHNLPVHEVEERKRVYEQEIAASPAFRELKDAFDTWCAVWFWPADLLDMAPYPANLLNPPEKAREMVRLLFRRHHFFHWELEFPDVFTGPDSGFNAMIGNPPWEIQKPNSKEFFSNVDPMYRGYGKQEALDRQKEYFTLDAEVEKAWLEYCARLKALSNWTKFAGYPFGNRVTFDKYHNPEHDFPFDSDFQESSRWHRDWEKLRDGRSGYADPQHPFVYQGSAGINTYKMFLEVSHHALKAGGRMGFLVPSGIYSDKGAGALRRLFLKDSRWTHLYAFQNERFVFDAVDHRFKIAAVHVEKRGASGPLMTRFRLGPGDSPEVNELEEDILKDSAYLPVTRDQISRFSPGSSVIIETRSEGEIEILQKLYRGKSLLGDKSESSWRIRFHQGEFNMTSDSRLFPRRQKWEDDGYRSDEYGNWLKGGWQPYSGPQGILHRPKGLILSTDCHAAISVELVEDIALPLYQGAMIQLFDFCASAYQRQEGKRGFKWVPLQWERKQVEPQYLMGRRDYASADGVILNWKLAYRRISATTNQRTFISAIVPHRPCGDSVFLMSSPDPLAWMLGATTGSFAFDWIVRRRLGGSNLNFFMASELPAIGPSVLSSSDAFRQVVASLQFPAPVFAKIWRQTDRSRPWKQRWAVTDHERLRLRAINEVVVASLFGLDSVAFSSVVRACDHSVAQLESKPFTRTLDTKGFWRFEKGKDPELRIAVLAQVAFRELEQMGIEAFLQMNDGEGWMLPGTVRLADYGLGHDYRAKEPQPVASRLGPRFYDWQLEQGLAESWEECERHAEILDRILPTQKEASEPASEDGEASGPTDLFGTPLPTDLFGTPVYPKSKRR